MGLINLPTRANGQNVDETWFNRLKSALVGIFVPRNANGSPEDEAGSLGTETYRWKKMHVASGDLFVGAVKFKYRYTSVTVPIDKGWMLMDGRIINQTNYDAEHGAGSWLSHGVASSPIAGKYLPDTNGRYFRGVTGEEFETQDGSAPITTSGQASVDISHTHGSGTLTSGFGSGATLKTDKLNGVNNIVDMQHTHTASLTAHSQTITLGPKAIEMNAYMRVV